MVRRNRNDNSEKANANRDATSEDGLIGRRSYLKLAGAAGGALVTGGALTGGASASSDVSFENAVDVVEEFDADPTGDQPVNGAIRDAASDGTVVEFPEGTYRFDGGLDLSGTGTVGLRGQGDVTFVAPDGFNGWLIDASVEYLHLEGIDVDITADNTTAGFRVQTQRGFHIADVEFVGRGTHNSGDQITNMINCAVKNSDETGVIENLTAKKGSAWAHYHPRGRVGIWAGGSHEGTLEVVDCHIEEFGNNGMYCSRCPGKVQVYGGFFRNNNVSSIRISGEGSFVDGATIEIDPDAYTGPNTQEDDAFDMRGVVVESAAAGQGKPRGAAVRNTEITVKPNPTNGEGIRVWGNGRTVEVSNCRIQMDHDRPAIRRDKKRQQGKWDPSDDPRWIRVSDTTITGSAEGPAVAIREASGSRVENCCIDQDGSNSDGIVIDGSDDCLVRDTSIDVAGEELNLGGSNVETENVVEGACSKR